MSEQEFLVRDSRQPGHFWADNEVMDIYGSLLGAHGMAVYMALCRNSTNGTGECRISMGRIARQLDISKGGVFNALNLIVKLSLARLVQEGTPRTPAVYVLADVKSLCNPEMAQMRLNASVHGMNAQPKPSVHVVNANGHGVNAAFIGRTRNKEDNTSYKTTKLNPPTPAERGLTPRQLQNLSKELQRIYSANVGTYSEDFEEQAIKTACLRLCLPLEAARKAIAASEGVTS